jgi:hypothetical protein
MKTSNVAYRRDWFLDKVKQLAIDTDHTAAWSVGRETVYIKLTGKDFEMYADMNSVGNVGLTMGAQSEQHSTVESAYTRMWNILINGDSLSELEELPKYPADSKISISVGTHKVTVSKDKAIFERRDHVFVEESGGDRVPVKRDRVVVKRSARVLRTAEHKTIIRLYGLASEFKDHKKGEVQIRDGRLSIHFIYGYGYVLQIHSRSEELFDIVMSERQFEEVFGIWLQLSGLQ